MLFAVSSVPEFLSRQTGEPRDDGLMIYAPEDIAERNQTYELAQYLPDHLMVGDDSGGRGILLDSRGAVWICGLGALFLDMRELLSPHLSQWVEQGCPLPDWDDEDDE